MIGQITPLVQAARKRVWIQAIVAHAAGATLAASILGAVLGTCGSVIAAGQWKPWAGIATGALFLACALRDGGIWEWPLPSLQRQTPAWFKWAFGPAWGSFAWGADLGLGWTTYVTFTGYYGLALWALLDASPLQGAMILASYGLGRALPVLAAAVMARGNDFATLHILHLRDLQRINAIVLAFTAGYFLVGG